MTEEIHTILGRIDERTKAIKERQDEHIKTTSEVLHDHEDRIRKNTKFRITLLGWIAGAGGLGAAFTKLLGGGS